MRQAIDFSLSKLPRSDIEAIVSYLRTVPARPSSYIDVKAISSVASLQASQPWSPPSGIKDEGIGLRIFEGACASCHGWDGSGQNVPWASLEGSRTVNDPSGSNLIRAILQGSSDSADNPATTMPSFASAYSDAELASLANYVIGHFGGKKGTVTPGDIATAR
jgi:mono/diheme cytochrome c family protein